jgi:hypothetical protein
MLLAVATAFGLTIDMLSDRILKPQTNGGPRYCIENTALSVNTRISCRVCWAVTIADPDDRRKLPAWFVIAGAQT